MSMNPFFIFGGFVARLVSWIGARAFGIGIEDVTLDVVCDLLETAIDEIGILDILKDVSLRISDDVDVPYLAELLDDADAKVDASDGRIVDALDLRSDESPFDDDPSFGESIFLEFLSSSGADDVIDPEP